MSRQWIWFKELKLNYDRQSMSYDSRTSEGRKCAGFNIETGQNYQTAQNKQLIASHIKITIKYSFIIS